LAVKSFALIAGQYEQMRIISAIAVLPNKIHWKNVKGLIYNYVFKLK